MVVGFDDLAKLARHHKGQNVVFTGGCFDLLHEGHLEALKYRKSLGDILIVGISSDERVRQKKGPSRPIQTEFTRVTVMAALREVDYAFVMPMPTDESPTMQVIKALQPAVFADSIEYFEKWGNDIEVIQSYGTKVVFENQPRLNSTTQIINNSILQPIM